MPGALRSLLEVAGPQRGLFTVEQAAQVDVDDVTVRKLAARGALERRAQGVYRIVTFPFDELTEYMEATLWPKGRGTIAGEAALVLWKLGDVNPRWIDLAVPIGYRPRRRGGERYRVRQLALEPADVDEIEGISVVIPQLAIQQAIDDGVPADLVEQALRQAEARELIGRRTAAHLLVALDERGATTREA